MAVASFNLADLDGINGFTVNGIDEGDNSGFAVSEAGDFNGDGIDDLIIGARGATPNGYDSGQSYIVFGSSNGFTSTLELASLNGTNGFAFNGINEGDSSGSSVSGAGDVNGDGFDDIIIGAVGASTGSGSLSGQSYIVFGNSGSFSPTLELSDLDGTNGFALNGIEGPGFSGISVSDAGDVNGDDFDDFIIGAPNVAGGGQSYVIFGASGRFAPTLELSTLNGSNGFVLNGISQYDFSGVSVSSAGDFNGDGFDDLVVGASGAGSNGFNSGQSYVIFGASDGFMPALELSNLDGRNGFILNGIDQQNITGNSVSSAGDVNGDGLDDIIIGALGADPNGSFSGQSYVVFGARSGFKPVINLVDLDGTNGFALNGISEYDSSGGSVSGAGDVNGDGFDDIIVGAVRANPNGAFSGQSYVVFGASNNFPPTLDLADLDGSNGFALNGINAGDFSGVSVSNAGDINGDGTDDLIIGADNANPNTISYAGQSYVVFGGAFEFAPEINGTSTNDILTGTPNNNRINGLEGDDRLTGGGGQDQFAIAAGDGTDTISDFGGVGTGANPSQSIIDEADTLKFSGSELTPKNMLITQNGSDLEITFERVRNTKVILQNFSLADLDNLTTETSASVSIGNILFNKQTEIEDSFDVFDANQNRNRVFNRNTVTFLNELDNITSGFNSSDDVINGQGGNDFLSGLSGNDLLRGNSGDDSLEGGLGDDTLLGNKGNDLLRAMEGNDLLRGGRGNDVLRGGTDEDTLFGDQGRDDLRGGQGDDLLRGGLNRDRLDGSQGRDTLIGQGGRDLLNGGSDNDSLSGGAGDDLINGDEGNDILTGGLGLDTFRFGANPGTDTITDFSANQDKLDVGQFFSDIDQILGVGGSAQQVGSATVIDLGSNNLATLLDVNVSELSEANFLLG